MDYSQKSDELLLYLLKEKNHKAFTELYLRHHKTLYVHVYKMLRDEEESWDVIQNLFTTLWKNADRIEITISLKAYLYKMARNLTLNAIQKSKTRERHIESFARFLNQSESVIEEQINVKDLTSNVQHQLREMGPRMREVFVKCRLEGAPHKEVAIEMGISENTVKTVLHRATKMLRRGLNTFLFVYILPPFSSLSILIKQGVINID